MGGGLQRDGGRAEAHAAVSPAPVRWKPITRGRRRVRTPSRSSTEAPSWPSMRTSWHAARTSGAVGPSARTTDAGRPGPGRTGPSRPSTASTAAAAGTSTNAISSSCRTASTPIGPRPARGPRRGHPRAVGRRPGRAGQQPKPRGQVRPGGPQLCRHLGDEGLPLRCGQAAPWRVRAARVSRRGRGFPNTPRTPRRPTSSRSSARAATTACESVRTRLH